MALSISRWPGCLPEACVWGADVSLFAIARCQLLGFRECHNWSVAPISLCSHQGPRSYFSAALMASQCQHRAWIVSLNPLTPSTRLDRPQVSVFQVFDMIGPGIKPSLPCSTNCTTFSASEPPPLTENQHFCNCSTTWCEKFQDEASVSGAASVHSLV